MTRACLTVAAICVVVGLAAPSIAGQVKLEIRGGLVTLEAKDATIREIFAEWARVGKTRVVNAETAPGGPLTLQFTDVPERQALDIILRSVAGFLAVARTSPLDSASMYDRILVMPVARPAGVAAYAAGRAGSQPQQVPSRDRIMIPPPMMVTDEDEEPQTAPMPGPGAYGGAQQPGMPTPQLPFNGAGMASPGGRQVQPGSQGNPYGTPYGAPYNPNQPGNPNGPPAEASPRTAPAVPQAAPRPGVMTPPAGPIKG